MGVSGVTGGRDASYYLRQIQRRPTARVGSAAQGLPREAGMVTGPTVTLAEAARRSHLSLATLRRWLVNADKLPGAERNAVGAWSIPVASLVESGAWSSATPAAVDQAEALEAGSAAERNAELADQVAALTAELAAERIRRESADKLREAAERNADDLRAAMRLLEA